MTEIQRIIDTFSEAELYRYMMQGGVIPLACRNARKLLTKVTDIHADVCDYRKKETVERLPRICLPPNRVRSSDEHNPNRPRPKYHEHSRGEFRARVA